MGKAKPSFPLRGALWGSEGEGAGIGSSATARTLSPPLGSPSPPGVQAGPVRAPISTMKKLGPQDWLSFVNSCSVRQRPIHLTQALGGNPVTAHGERPSRRRRPLFLATVSSTCLSRAGGDTLHSDTPCFVIFLKKKSDKETNVYILQHRGTEGRGEDPEVMPISDRHLPWRGQQITILLRIRFF